MKEIERVSIGGYAFTLDTDAATLAGSYLDELEAHYKDREGGAEIIEGIEERMAELLQERRGRDGVVSRTDVEDIMRILGRPEDIDDEEQPDPDTTGKKKEGEPRRKLYRDLSNKVVAGVCSGLGAYFNVDTVLFRLLFVAVSVTMLFLGHRNFLPEMATPILYAILWICMPPAKTVQQRWEQRGEDGTLNSIQRSVENGAREVEEAVREIGKSRFWSEAGSFIEKFIGLILLIIGFSGLFAGGVWTFGSGRVGPHSGNGLFGLGQLYDLGLSELRLQAPSVADALVQPGMHILLLLVVFLPFLGLLYGGLQLLFGFKSPKWHPGLVIFILWLLCIIAAGILVTTGVVTTEMLLYGV